MNRFKKQLQLNNRDEVQYIFINWFFKKQLTNRDKSLIYVSQMGHFNESVKKTVFIFIYVFILILKISNN